MNFGNEFQKQPPSFFKKATALAIGIILTNTACSSSRQPQNTNGFTVPKACKPYQVWGQNRWTPIGAGVHTAPDILAPRHQPGYAGNEVAAVDAWVHTTAPYPHNPTPFDSNIWFHLADGEGWVDFAGVRGAPTYPDPTLQSKDGGPPAPTPPKCQTTYYFRP